MCIDHDPYQTQAPEGRKVYMGTCCQTPVTPAGVQETVGHRFLYTCRPAGAKELWVLSLL